MNMNRVTLVGRLGTNPELKNLGSDNFVCNMNVATNKHWVGADKEKKEKTVWHKVVVWGKKAQWVANNLKKGSNIMIDGEIETKEWSDKEDNKRVDFYINAKQIEPMATLES